MNSRPGPRCAAFEGARCIASGTLAEVVARAKPIVDRAGPAAVLIFDDTTSALVEIDFRGSLAEVLDRVQSQQMPHATTDAPHATDAADAPPAKRGPGRPKLGVVAREVTLLPRHWEWLNEQPGGASVALRKLVEAARRANEHTDRARRARDAAYRFMSTMAGDAPGFEEATRALFARDKARFDSLVAAWPRDVGAHASRVAAGAFVTEDAS